MVQLTHSVLEKGSTQSLNSDTFSHVEVNLGIPRPCRRHLLRHSAYSRAAPHACMHF